MSKKGESAELFYVRKCDKTKFQTANQIKCNLGNRHAVHRYLGATSVLQNSLVAHLDNANSPIQGGELTRATRFQGTQNAIAVSSVSFEKIASEYLISQFIRINNLRLRSEAVLFRYQSIVMSTSTPGTPTGSGRIKAELEQKLCKSLTRNAIFGRVDISC
jgi:hypothetical protein